MVSSAIWIVSAIIVCGFWFFVISLTLLAIAWFWVTFPKFTEVVGLLLLLVGLIAIFPLLRAF